MTTRRHILIAGTLGALAPLRALAQTRTPRIGMLSGAPLEKSFLAAQVLEALAQFGYRQGKEVTLEYRHSNRPSDYPALARQLVAAKCDVVFAFVTEPIGRALRDASTGVPIVLLAFDYDPVEKGLVKSYARPGGHLTGVYSATRDLTAKRFEVAHEALPGAKRFLVLSDHHMTEHLAVLRKTAAARGVQLTVAEFATAPYDLRGAFERGRREGVDAVFVFTVPEFAMRRAELSALLAEYKLPSTVGGPLSAEPGILISYSVDVRKGVTRGVEMAVRIFNGAKPAEMPIEQLDAFELVVNLKTAKALGIKIPYSVLSRATRVIE
jgi:putative ABC transport system substrate-binding protein